jgi:hypothetical protein
MIYEMTFLNNYFSRTEAERYEKYGFRFKRYEKMKGTFEIIKDIKVELEESSYEEFKKNAKEWFLECIEENGKVILK